MTHDLNPAGRVSSSSLSLFSILCLSTLLLLLLPCVSRSQATGVAQTQNEESLLLAFINCEPGQTAKIKALITENQHLVSPRLWEKLIERAAAAYYYVSPEKALAIYNIALEVASSLNDKKLLAATHYKIGLTYSGIGQTESAIQAHLISKNLFEEAGLQKDLVYILSDLGSLYFHLQNYDEAKRFAEQSITLANSLKNSPAVAGAWPDNFGVAGALSTLGFISQQHGNLMQSIEYLGQSLALYRELDGGSSKFGIYIADKLSAIGGAYNLAGDNGQALFYLNQALEVARKTPYPNTTASVLNNLGVLYLDQEDYARASDYFNQGLQIYQAQRNQPEIARVLLNLGVMRQRQGDYDRALEFFRESLEQAAKISNKELIIAAEEGIGAVQQVKGDIMAALETLNRGLALAKEVNDQVRIAEILWRKAETHYAARNYVEAVALAESALKLARQLQLPKLSYLIATTLGRAYIGQKKPGPAKDMLSQAVEQVEVLRTRVAGQEQERQLFLENKVGAYHSLIELLIVQDKPVDALLYAERAKSRVLLDLLSAGSTRTAKALAQNERGEEQRLNRAIIEINNEIRDEQLKTIPAPSRLNQLGSRLNSARLKYASFQDLLYISHSELKAPRGQLPVLTQSSLDNLIEDGQTAYLEYVVAKDHVFLFVLTKDQPRGADVRVYTINVKEAELTKMVSDYHQMMADRIPTFATLSRRLYDLLLKPAESQLKDKSSLCIIPDGALWDAPFQAIQTQAGRYLIEDFAIHYAPSLSVLSEVTRRGLGSRAPSLLAFGNPLAGAEVVARLQESNRGGTFASLPEAEAEVKALSQMFSPNRSRIFTGARAGEKTFKSLASGYSILHFATHGVLDDRHPLFSYLLLSRPPGDVDEDGLLEAREIMDLDLRADLVVLSACETARGKIGAGEGVIGMSWAFLVAGCRTTVVSQWSVNSPSTSELMAGFYRHLRPATVEGRKMKDEALRLAALELIKDSRYRHPYYWAGFVMVGSNR